MKTIRPQTPPQKKVEEKKVINTYAWESTVTHTDLTTPDGECIRVDEATNIATPIVPNVEVESIDKQGNKWVVYDEADKYPLTLPQAIKTPTKEERRQFIEKHARLCQEFGLLDNKTLPQNIETLMSETQAEIDTNQIKVEFTLTKRQYDLWVKKGEVRWLKKALVGIKVKKKKLK